MHIRNFRIYFLHLVSVLFNYYKITALYGIYCENINGFTF